MVLVTGFVAQSAVHMSPDVVSLQCIQQNMMLVNLTLEENLNICFHFVLFAGQGLAFVIYPEALTTFWCPQLWSFVFFVMLYLLGIDSEVRAPVFLLMMLHAHDIPYITCTISSETKKNVPTRRTPVVVFFNEDMSTRGSCKHMQTVCSSL